MEEVDVTYRDKQKKNKKITKTKKNHLRCKYKIDIFKKKTLKPKLEQPKRYT